MKGHTVDHVTVNKAKLLETLTYNRDQHREKFLKAQGVYRARVIEELDKRLAEARRPGGRINLGFALPEPTDYTAEYDAAIEMLDWELADEVKLDSAQFRQLVLNEWGWARQFAATTGVYLAE